MTGHPSPVVTWRKSSGQLPQGRVHYNNAALRISDVRKSDSDTYFCSAVNLLGSDERGTLLVVVPFPRFSLKSPVKVFASLGSNLTLQCSATGDPQPVITWKRQGGKLPVGRSHVSKEALIFNSVKQEDAGNYTCVATSAGVSSIEHRSQVVITKGYFSFATIIEGDIFDITIDNWN